MNTEAIISNYVEQAIAHDRATEEGNSDAANKAYDKNMEALKELRKLPDKGKVILSRLLSHENVGVRVSAATHLLPLDEKKAVRVLEEVSKLPGLVAFDAKMVLQEWRAGRLQIP